MASLAAIFAIGKPVALEASAEERLTRGFISITSMRPSTGLMANCTFEPPVSTPISRSTAIEASDPGDIIVCVLDRPRHAQLLKDLRQAGARIRLIRDGDVAAAIETARIGTGIDILMGIGGTPEGVVTAAAMRALGGVIQGQLMPQSESEKESARAAGHDLSKIYSTNDLVSSDDVFFSATGITDGELLRGVRHNTFGAVSHSLVVRGRSKTVRIIETEHR